MSKTTDNKQKDQKSTDLKKKLIREKMDQKEAFLLNKTIVKK